VCQTAAKQFDLTDHLPRLGIGSRQAGGGQGPSSQTLIFWGVLDTQGVVKSADVSWPGHPEFSAAQIIGIPFWQAPWTTNSPSAERTVRQAFVRAAFGKAAIIQRTCRFREGERIGIQLRLQRFELNGTTAVQAMVTIPAPVSREREEAVRLLYSVSHDLREPLRMVHLYAQLIQSRHGAWLDAEGNRLLGEVINGARRTSELVDSMLSSACLDRLQRGESPVEVEASWALEVAKQNLKALVDETGAQVDSGPLPVVLANRAELPRVFQNLIGNAIKFRRPGVTPHVAIRASAVEGFWEFTVADNGIGFSPEQSATIFESFTRLRTHAGGTGLGLAICRRIVGRMGGTIWAESQPGAGSIFRFTVPAVGQR
jgi:signal transduction histidine kinase